MRLSLKLSAKNVLLNMGAGVLAALMLTACGGGGGSPGATSGNTSNPSTGGSPTVLVPAAINFVSAVPADKSIVIKGAGGNGRTESALLTFMVVDKMNVAVPGVTVNFTTINTKPVVLTSAVGVTDAAGKVVATVNSGVDPTTVRVTATIQGTAISVISDTVTVTTGQPTQERMTLAREKVNVEGINYAGETNKITAFMADESGGVVANGTQIVFTTDSGAIVGDGGTNDTARCLTTNGACSVVWRSQNPAKSVVKVIATATVTPTTASPDGLLSESIYFTNSGSFAVAVPTPMPNLTVAASNVWNLNFPADCAAQTIHIAVTDAFGYTMPDASILKIENALSSTLTVFPEKIVAPSSISAGPSLHDITVTPAGCTGNSSGTDSPVLSITSPLGGLVQFRVNITFPK